MFYPDEIAGGGKSISVKEMTWKTKTKKENNIR